MVERLMRRTYVLKLYSVSYNVHVQLYLVTGLCVAEERQVSRAYDEKRTGGAMCDINHILLTRQTLT